MSGVSGEPTKEMIARAAMALLQTEIQVSLTEPVENYEKQAAEFIEEEIRLTLEVADWYSPRRLVQVPVYLGADLVRPENAWFNYYRLDANVRRVVGVYGCPHMRIERTGRVARISATDSVMLECVLEHESVGEYSAHLRAAMAARLAWRLSRSVTDSRTERKEAEQYWHRARRSALAAEYTELKGIPREVSETLAIAEGRS